LLLIRAVVDKVAKTPELAAPLPPAEDAWELLARTQQAAPLMLDRILDHPYTGAWAGYTTRLLYHRITGVGPLWAHIGYLHAVAAAAAVHAGINFEITVPVWHGDVVLPTLGLARGLSDLPWSVARVSGVGGRVRIASDSAVVRLPTDPATSQPDWWGIRKIVAHADHGTLSVRLDDLDPYRGSYEPLPPQRVDDAELATWQRLLPQAWQLLVECVPDVAEALRVGFDSLAPRPAVPFRTPSSSSDEAFGSAVIARPSDAPTLAATLVHEFQHSRLSGLQHLVPLSEADPRERFYTGWRDDPRPIGGLIQGIFAFFGMTAFWRALATKGARPAIAPFEFAHHRAMTWQAVTALRDDTALTEAGHRFVQHIADILGPWQQEVVGSTAAEAAAAITLDHYLGWRIRHVRPHPDAVSYLATAWRDGGVPPRRHLPDSKPPTPVPDGSWSRARADLIRLVLAVGDRADQDPHREEPTLTLRAWDTVPDATLGDFAWATGRLIDAVRCYRTELIEDPDRPASLVGLALSLPVLGPSRAVRMLTHRPELVRAVHRAIRARTTTVPSYEDLAEWIGRVTR
jgi:HEXXH motif-containing protein